MTPVCHHGHRMWDSEKPYCEDPGCHLRWWLRYGVPLLLFIAAAITVGILWPTELGAIGSHHWAHQPR